MKLRKEERDRQKKEFARMVKYNIPAGKKVVIVTSDYEVEEETMRKFWKKVQKIRDKLNEDTCALEIEENGIRVSVAFCPSKHDIGVIQKKLLSNWYGGIKNATVSYI